MFLSGLLKNLKLFKKSQSVFFNETMTATKSEEKARIASLAAMKNAEDAENKDKVLKGIQEILKSKYV